jgi:hypothetical protein
MTNITVGMAGSSNLRTYKDAMLDLETMGVGSNPALLQIAAVAFDINTGEFGDSFDMKIDLTDAMKYGTVSASTVAFWMSQKVSQEARDNVMQETPNWGKPGVTLTTVLHAFNTWLAKNGIEYVHGNGVASDNVWMRNAYERTGIEQGFDFRQDFCFRTLKSLAYRMGWEDTVKREGIYHDGLDDSKHQVKVLRDVLAFLGVSGIK